MSTADAYNNQCTYKSESGRRCKLDAGHPKTDQKHGHMFMDRKGVSTPHIASVVPTGFSLTMEAIPKDANLARAHERTPEPRDEWQTKVDDDAKRVYAKWDKAGKPSADFATLATRVGGRYIVPPEASESVVAMLRRVQTAGGPLVGKHLSYRKTKHESGNTAVNYVFTDHSENVTDTPGRKKDK